MNDPNVIFRIDRHTCNRANQPVIGQWLRPHGINFERRDLRGVLRHKDRRGQQQGCAKLLHLYHRNKPTSSLSCAASARTAGNKSGTAAVSIKSDFLNIEFALSEFSSNRRSEAL